MDEGQIGTINNYLCGMRTVRVSSFLRSWLFLSLVVSLFSFSGAEQQRISQRESRVKTEIIVSSNGKRAYALPFTCARARTAPPSEGELLHHHTRLSQLRYRACATCFVSHRVVGNIIRSKIPDHSDEEILPAQLS
jgi:hypothetical protein